MSFLQFLFRKNKSKYRNIKLLDPLEFNSKIKDRNVQLIDVRTPNEYHQGKINKAINIDFYAYSFIDNFNSFEKDKPVYLYCKSGVRSRKAAKKLAELGFNELYDLHGGIMNWRRIKRD